MDVQKWPKFRAGGVGICLKSMKGIAMRASPNSGKGLHQLRAAWLRPFFREPTRKPTRFRVPLAIFIVFGDPWLEEGLFRDLR